VPEFCDVAVPVPLDATFTYRVRDGLPVVGGRVLVPFRDKRLSGIVTKLHDSSPSFATKDVIGVLDAEPLLDACLLRLGEWIAHYYIAPLGEVFRTMLPLFAEFRRAFGYHITDAGVAALEQFERASRISDEELARSEVLDYLAERELAREEAIRSATGATRTVLQSLLRKKWIARQDLSRARESKRVVRVAVLSSGASLRADGANSVSTRAPAALSKGQRAILDALAAAGGRMKLDKLNAAGLSRSSLQTLVKRGLIQIVEEAMPFAVSALDAKKRSPLGFIFNPEQQRALVHIEAAVSARQFSATLLHGVTGSGKTAVYLAAMQSVMAAGRSAIMLVPEIGLTPAAAAQLHQVFGEQVAILHSALTDAERAEQWHRIRRGAARLVVGTRSAVFAPVCDLALIVVDEEHDLSYKQDETPRYNGRDVAIMRAKMSGAAVVLGSATPSLESYRNATSGKYKLIELPSRVEARPLPEVELVDMRAEFRQEGKQRVISRKLAQEVEDRLARGEQAMILLNRRGWATVALCRSCGESVQCKNCAVAMTQHKRERRMVCHYCGYTQRVPQTCPKCGSEYVYFLGTGSEKLEEILHSMFPQARIGRLDRDTVRGRHDFERVLNALHAGELDLLIGTQMIAKGHDIHGITLVGVVGADAALSFPDFRAAERTFQLLTQVAGRAGRGTSPGKVILQTLFCEHYAVQFAARHDYAGFFDKELRFRSWMHYPPFTALANVLVRSDKLEEALKFSGIIGQWFRAARHEGVRVLGPAAAPIVRLKRDYRYHFILKSPSREKLNALLRAMLSHAAANKIPRSNLIVDVDALALL
jgi:primosomal protein N' (replication factor Y)